MFSSKQEILAANATINFIGILAAHFSLKRLWQPALPLALSGSLFQTTGTY